MFSSIDIGTNTIRCLVSDSKKNVLTPEYVDMKIIRLGENFSREGVITGASIERLRNALGYYMEKISSYGIKRKDIVVTGTSVLRDAPNSPEILKEIHKDFGIKINIIGGEKEADITLRGISSCFDDLKNFYAVDIGGGSTEYSCFRNGKALWRYSLNLGVVHLTEKFIKSDPVSKHDLSLMEKEIDSMLSSLKIKILKTGYIFEPLDTIGTAGTATTLAMVDLGLKDYDRLRVHGYTLKKEKIKKIYKKFIEKTSEERLGIPGVEHGREDLVLAGAAIMYKGLDFFEADRFTVSECGLLEGLIEMRVENLK